MCNCFDSKQNLNYSGKKTRVVEFLWNSIHERIPRGWNKGERLERGNETETDKEGEIVACDSRGQRARRKARKGGEGSELSFSAPEADTFAGARHDHPLGVLRIFQWKFRVKGTRRLEPRLDHIEIKQYATLGIIDFRHGGGSHPYSCSHRKNTYLLYFVTWNL